MRINTINTAVQQTKFNNNAGRKMPERKAPSFGANVYAVFHGTASDLKWTEDALDKLHVTFIKQAIETGAIDIKNAAIAACRCRRTGEIKRINYTIPEKIEFALLDITTPEYKKYWNVFDLKSDPNEIVENIKNSPDTKKIKLFIDEKEKLSVKTAKDLHEFFDEIAKMFGAKKEDIMFDTPKEQIPSGIAKILEENNYEFRHQSVREKEILEKTKGLSE